MRKQKTISKRFSPEQQQEDRSVNQFCDRMVEFGWSPERIGRDIGEDLLVRILTPSQPVGVPIYVQLKSITDMADRRRDDFLAYRPIDVVDLLRWESSSIPVVLVVWDITLREGRWQTVESLVEHLDQKRPSWRRQKTTTVYIPWSNSTDDSGLQLLRSEIGHMLYDLIASNRNLKINVTVAFPETDEAAADRLKFEKFIREGTPVSIDSRYIQKLQFSEWWTEWFAAPDLEISTLTMGPVFSTKAEPATLILFGTDQPAVHYPNLELRLVRVGTDLLVLSNEHQNGPLSVTLYVPKTAGERKRGRFSFSVSTVGHNVLEIREIIRFLQSMRVGGRLSILFRRLNSEGISVTFAPPPEESLPGELLDPPYVEFIKDLCYIQERLGHQIRLPEGDIKAVDVLAANELKEILKHGKIVRHTDELSFTVHGIELLTNLLKNHRTAESDSKLIVQLDGSSVELFGEQFHVDPMIRTIVGHLNNTVDELEAHIQHGDDTLPFTIRLTNVGIIDEFSEWHA